MLLEEGSLVLLEEVLLEEGWICPEFPFKSSVIHASERRPFPFKSSVTHASERRPRDTVFQRGFVNA